MVYEDGDVSGEALFATVPLDRCLEVIGQPAPALARAGRCRSITANISLRRSL